MKYCYWSMKYCYWTEPPKSEVFKCQRVQWIADGDKHDHLKESRNCMQRSNSRGWENYKCPPFSCSCNLKYLHSLKSNSRMLQIISRYFDTQSVLRFLVRKRLVFTLVCLLWLRCAEQETKTARHSNKKSIDWKTYPHGSCGRLGTFSQMFSAVT